MLYQIRAQVRENREVAPEVYRMSIHVPVISHTARPGQFLHIRVDDSFDPLLRRPISINGVGREEGLVFLLYRVVGSGTQRLSEKKSGQNVDVLGPLGNGFTLQNPTRGATLALIAGGMGIAPLNFLLEELKDSRSDVLVFLGAQTKESILGEAGMAKMGYTPRVATDDGSFGYRGPVTDLFKESLNDRTTGFAYACGPPAMLRQVSVILQKHNIPGEISLEERMGCGLGACLSCVCKIKDPNSAGGFTYQRACTEGPVFPVGEVLFE
ncbi:MAG TPA: dihydroorotate dehydrogenase electron transfer subunit [Clostridia bacterium]|nr:dihydroorotate dehydrogenase electron transfer subunit [Clostridia bacterium]